MGRTQGEEITALQEQVKSLYKVVEGGFSRIETSIGHVRQSQKEHETNDKGRHEDTIKADKMIMMSIEDYKKHVAKHYVTKDRMKTVGMTVVTVRSVLIALGSNLPNIIQAFGQ